MGQVVSDVFLDANGNVQSVEIKKGLTPDINLEIKKALLTLGKFKPATINEVNKPSIITIPYTFKSAIPYDSVKIKYVIDNFERLYKEYIIENRIKDSIAFENEKQDIIMALVTDNIENLLFSSKQFGLINCDRFNNQKVETFFVDNNNENKEVFNKRFMIIFKNINSILNTKYAFEAPDNSDVLIVGIKYENGQLYMGSRNGILNSKQNQINLTYSAATPEQIKSKLLELE